MRTMIVTAVTVLAFSSVAKISGAEQAFDGILSLTPVGEHSCLSISVPVTPGQPIAGLTWIHNDASTAFPKLLIMEGTIGQPPDLTQTSLVLEEITGESLGTGTVTFGTPIISSTDVIDVVFQLPAFTEKTGDGLGGGPGIGYVNERGAAAAYASGDGIAWTRLHPDFSMKVETVVVLGRGMGQAQSLTDLRDSRPSGWWDALTPREDVESLALEEGNTPSVTETNPLVVVPNPFNPRTTVKYYVGEPSTVDVSVYDVRGRRVTSLFGGSVDAGAHEIVWEGVDDQGRSVSSGVYHIRMTTPTQSHHTRAVVVR